MQSLKNTITLLQSNQLSINVAKAAEATEAFNRIQPHIGQIVRVTYLDNGPKVVCGVIPEEQPINMFHDTIRLNLKSFNFKSKLVEQRRRVIPVTRITDIEILGTFKTNS